MALLLQVGIALLCKHAQPARLIRHCHMSQESSAAAAVSQPDHPPSPARHPPTDPALPPSHPARHAPIPPHTCADRAASRGCSLRLQSAVWPDSNARAIPTAQGLGLIPQLLWVARFSAVRHLTRRTPRHTPSSAAPRTAHRAAHPRRFVHNPRLPPSAASISCRSQSDAHSEPP